jgi:hypothetical protein
MTKLRLSGLIGLGTLFLGVTLGYAFFQPYIPGAVYDAIPAQATFVHKTDSLEKLLESPVCGQLDKALGAGNSLDALVSSSGWFKLTVPSEIAVADMPMRYAGQSKAWAAVSWVGWRSPWLRWRLEHTRAEGFSFIGKHAVWPIWQYESPDIARGSSLTFALTDNLFIALLSDNPSDIRTLLNAYDNRRLSVSDIK